MISGKVLLLSALVFVFVYKLAFLTKDIISSKHRLAIYRDQEGVPHVYSHTKKDVYFGMGYAQGQDKLWTLFLKRIFIQGRLAELFGQSALPSDLEIRNLNFHNVGKMNAALVDNQTRQLVQAYIDGINQYARSVKMLPFEFYLFWTDWQDWQIKDSLALLAFFSFSLQFDWLYEIARQRLLETVGFDLAYKIITFGQQNLFRKVSIMNEDQVKTSGRYKPYDSSKQKDIIFEHWGSKNISLGSIHIPHSAYEGSGSNGWIVSGKYTESGRPILANDPHLTSFVPSMMYAIEIVLLDQNNQAKIQTFGLMADGLPSISIGVNNKYAWGSTAGYIDNKDVFHQTTRHHNSIFQYQQDGQWYNFTTRQQTIKVRGGDDIQEVFYHTNKGVVLETIYMGIHMKYGYPLPDKYREEHTLTLQAAIYIPDSTSSKGLLDINFRQSREGSESLSEEINCPNLDSFFIDNQGNFAYIAVGRIPKRDIPEMGSFIKDGRHSYYDMKEFLTWAQKPKMYNPAKGYISMANNRFALDSYDVRASMHEIVPGRAYRIHNIFEDKIAQGHKFTFQDMIDMQLDLKDQFLSEIFPKVLAHLNLPKLRAIWASIPKAEQCFKLLQRWDYTMPRTSVPTALYHVLEHLFHASLFAKAHLSEEEMEAIVEHAFFENYQFVLFEKVVNGSIGIQETIVCQTIETKKYANLHPCQASIAIAMQKLPAELANVFGSQNINDYQWGAIHRSIYKSIPFSDIPLLKYIWERSYPAGGNSRTLNVGILTHQTKSYHSYGRPVFRFISDINTTYYSLDIGNSDRLFSNSYDNFLDKDRYVEYKRHNPRVQPLPPGWQLCIDTI